MVYLILNEIEVTSSEQLEQLIVDLPDESKLALRNLLQEAKDKLG